MKEVLDRAFTKARLAVPPKWCEAARIERISAPNDPKEVYQITTAFGIYCMYYPDKINDIGGAGANRVQTSPIVVHCVLAPSINSCQSPVCSSSDLA
ncbi:hypothetical protein IP91_03304 [Pseudoduganella lurida]|uniref:Uncharacterized protein n=1 Tax=Pseudoduganella lurida TaxID=1036180 RepID=A0A562R7Z2_9BURK|nr:hypothetical protein [Pseudoduganella lurida]TWI64530.1 hypothetical protein IP91_03304 [Pseudoduganella lurida]